MSRQQVLQVGIAVILIISLLVGCGGSTPTTVSEAPTATSAPEQTAATPTPEPPTATSEPPTDTPTLEPPTATPTPEPPTATPAPPTATLDPTKGKIEGKVSRSDTNEPIANAEINLNNPALNTSDPAYIVAKAISDKQGYYSLTDLKPGTYGLGFVLALEGKNALPCDEFLFETSDSVGDWMLGTMITKSGVPLVIAVSDNFRVLAGDLLQMDFKLRCK